jgi:outer membrane protein assembly factor BamB
MRWIPGRRTVLTFGGLPSLAAVLFGAACSARLAEDKDKAEPPVSAAGPSWPMFGGTAGRNMVSPAEKGIADTWSMKKGKEANVKWVAKLGTYAYGGPVIAGGRIFVGTNNGSPRDKAVTGDKGVLMCFREADGEFLWQAVHDKLPGGDANDSPQQGVISTPAVDGDRVYYVSNRCELVCADVRGEPGTKKAKILWSLDMVAKLGVFPCQASSCSPLVVGDLVFAVTGNGVDISAGHALPAPKAPSFVAVNKKTGAVAWQDNSPGDKIMDGQWSNPAAAEVNGKWQVIFPGGDGWLYGFEAATGKLLWKFDLNPKKSTYKPGGRGDRSFPVATPVVWENKCYVAVGEEPDNCTGAAGHLWCIDIAKEPKNKEKDLSPVDDNFDPKAEANKDSGLVWHFGGPVMPKPEDGSREYVFGRTISTVAVVDGLVYAVDYAGFLECLDARTGKKQWEFDLLDNTWCSPYYVDGKVYMGTDGDLRIFTHGKALKEPKKVAMEQPTKVPPVAVNGVLYVNTGTHLYAIAPKSPG